MIHHHPKDTFSHLAWKAKSKQNKKNKNKKRSGMLVGSGDLGTDMLLLTSGLLMSHILWHHFSVTRGIFGS